MTSLVPALLLLPFLALGQVPAGTDMALPSEIGMLRLGMTYDAAAEAAPLEESTGGVCRVMLISTHEVGKLIPLDLYPGVIWLMFESYEPRAALAYMSLPIKADDARRMIAHYSSVLGEPLKSGDGRLEWTRSGVTVGIAVELEASSHPDRGYFTMRSVGFDASCGSHH